MQKNDLDISSLFTSQPLWLSEAGESETVIATKVRLARNLCGLTFPSSASDTSLRNVEELMKNKLHNIRSADLRWYIRFDKELAVNAQAITERRLAPRPFLLLERCRSVAVSSDQCLSIAVNDRDHVTLTHSSPGFKPDKTWEFVDKIDDELSEMIEYAYDAEFGFLTSSPTDVGTGMRLSVLFHLPALAITEEIKKAVKAANEIGYHTDSFLGRLDDSFGHLYFVSNGKTLGISEADIVAETVKIAPILEHYELAARDALVSPEKRAILEDRVGRAIGVLMNCRLLSLEEAMSCLSIVRLGAWAGKLPKRAGRLLFELLFDVQAAHIRLSGKRELSDAEVEMARSELVRKKLLEAIEN